MRYESDKELHMSELNPQPLPPHPGVVRIQVPPSVMYDLEKMQKVTANVLDRLGCGGCHSGRVLDFVHLDEFTVDPKTLDVKEVVARR
jgi:hypothetical protein